MMGSNWSPNFRFFVILIKKRFLVSRDVKLHEFQQTVRKKLNVESEKDGLFFFISNKKIEKISKNIRIYKNLQQQKSINHFSSFLKDKTMFEIYQESKDPDDGFLYIMYSDQERFGASIWRRRRL